MPTPPPPDAFSDFGDRHDLQSQLEERLRFESLIVDLSLKFINAPASEVDREIEDAQRRVCEGLGLDLSAVWQGSAETSHLLTLTHLYRPRGGPPTPERMDAQEYFPWSQQQLMAGKVVAVSSMEELPAEAARDQAVWQAYEIKSSLAIPLSAGGEPLIGVLSFNTMRAERAWPEALVKRLQLVAQVFANALARKHADEMLRENEERLNLAADSADAGLWSLNLRTGRYWLTRKTRELFGFAEDEEVTFDRFMTRVHPADQERVRAAMQAVVALQGENHIEYRVGPDDHSVRWFASRGRARGQTSAHPDRVMGVTAEITARKHAEQALQERLHFERLLADLSAEFVNQPSEQVDQVIVGGLRMLVETLGHDRSTIGEFSAGTGQVTVTHTYTAPGLEPLRQGTVIDARLPWYLEQVRSGKTIFIRRFDDWPPEADKERKFCRAEGIESNLTIPLKAGGPSSAASPLRSSGGRATGTRQLYHGCT
jgi:PAS domain S-box-containing protein